MLENGRSNAREILRLSNWVNREEIESSLSIKTKKILNCHRSSILLNRLNRNILNPPYTYIKRKILI